MKPDKYQELALKTWIGGADPVRHALLGLAGEAGELLELLKKHEYKPGFDWWQCKRCGFMPEDKKRGDVDYFAYTCFNGESHTPLVLDELGDYWFYLRIVTWQHGVTIDRIKGQNYHFWDIAQLLGMMAQNSTVALNDYLFNHQSDLSRLQVIWVCFTALLDKLDCPLDRLTELNYRKLNSEPTAHGWKR